MPRHPWLTATAIVVAALCSAPALAQVDVAAKKTQNPKPARQIYELRSYVLTADGDHSVIDTYLAKALIPALHRLGSGPVGVFTEVPAAKPRKTPRPPMLHVLITYPKLANWASSASKLAKDDAYQAAAKPYLDAPRAKPAYRRIKTRLFRAFRGWPQIQVGDPSAPRILEMRTYDSHSERKHDLKVEMFNRHEFKVFQDVGFQSVFYGQALAGEDLPSLTYMLRYKDMAEHKALWTKFRKDPGWLKLKGKKRYAQTVSGIESVFLTPTGYSEF